MRGDLAVGTRDIGSYYTAARRRFYLAPTIPAPRPLTPVAHMGARTAADPVEIAENQPSTYPGRPLVAGLVLTKLEGAGQRGRRSLGGGGLGRKRSAQGDAWHALILSCFAVGYSVPLAGTMLGVSLGRLSRIAARVTGPIRGLAGVVLIAAGFWLLTTI